MQDQVDKRVSLNALIQGNAVNAYLSGHHMVASELNAIDPQLVGMYDTFTHGSVGQYHQGSIAEYIDPAADFWTDFNEGTHTFSKHPFLSKHGQTLQEAANDYHDPKMQSMNVLIPLYQRLMRIESTYSRKLEEICKNAANQITGFPVERLQAQLTTTLHVNKNMSNSDLGRTLQQTRIGTVALQKSHTGVVVEAKAHIFPVLLQELVKGATEVIFLHGMKDLPADQYNHVRETADLLEDEPFLIQVGPELWRRFLQVRPKNVPLPKILMKLAKLQPKAVHNLLEQIVTNPEWARELLSKI